MNLLKPDQWPESLSQHVRTAKRPLIVVLGPTASGKTAFSIAVAKRISAGIPPAMGEIVNADSRQLYKHLDIGTAKITEAEKEGIPHHLFGVMDPSEEVTVSRYKEMAEREIDAVLERGNVPILVGGSMLYISAIIDGLEPLSPVPKALREKLEAAYDTDKGQTLYAKLQEIDPLTASSFHPNNRPYVVRAMAIYEDTGKPPSSLKKHYTCPYDLLPFGMYWERKPLTDRIKARTPLLLARGWVEEVQALRTMGFDGTTPAMKSHGYREVLAAIDTRHSTLDTRKLVEEVAHDPTLIEAIDAKTRQYAKRQMTWWKHDERIQWIAMA